MTHPAIAHSVTAPSPFRLTGSPRLRQNIGICHGIKLRLIRETETGAAGRGRAADGRVLLMLTRSLVRVRRVMAR